MKLETKRLLLRNFTAEDGEDFFAYSRQSSVFEMGGNAAHRTAEDAKNVLNKWVQDENRFAIVWKVNQKVIGHLSIKEDSKRGRMDTRELGCALNKEYHQQGIMSEAIQIVLKYLFSENIQFVWACCFQDNIPSKRMIAKCGFEFVKTGTFYSKSLEKTFLTYEYCIEKDKFTLY